MKTNDTFFI